MSNKRTENRLSCGKVIRSQHRFPHITHTVHIQLAGALSQAVQFKPLSRETVGPLLIELKLVLLLNRDAKQADHLYMRLNTVDADGLLLHA